MAEQGEQVVPGKLTQLNELVSRVTAPNPGMMTGPGTNSYLVGREALAVIDPGPDIESHLSVLLDAARGRIKWILCTHTHRDHSPCAHALKRKTGAQLLGFSSVPEDGRQDNEFRPDRALADGDTLATAEFTLQALHTPGHASNHLCYRLEGAGLLFSGDHVMQGSTVVISPPDGDMSAYLGSLERLLSVRLTGIAPGHGRIIEKPHDEVRRLIAHRLKREQKVAHALARKNPATLDELLPLVYDDVPERTHPVARRSLAAHLIKLERDKRVEEEGGRWRLLP